MTEYVNKADMWGAYGKAKDDIDMAEQFERLPTIDIVHCKESYWYSSDGTFCENLLRETRADWFCADGERSNDD